MTYDTLSRVSRICFVLLVVFRIDAQMTKILTALEKIVKALGKGKVQL